MKINVSDHYILGLNDIQLMSPVSLKVLRYISNVRASKKYKDLEMKVASAKELSDATGVSINTLYNHSDTVIDDLEDYKGHRIFESVRYKKGDYTFYLGPFHSKVTSPSAIRYDSKNLLGLNTMYSLCIYEMVKKAMLDDPRPVIDITMADMPAGFKRKTIYEFIKPIKRAVAQINSGTDIHIDLEGHPTQKKFTLNCKIQILNDGEEEDPAE